MAKDDTVYIVSLPVLIVTTFLRYSFGVPALLISIGTFFATFVTIGSAIVHWNFTLKGLLVGFISGMLQSLIYFMLAYVLMKSRLKPIVVALFDRLRNGF